MMETQSPVCHCEKSILFCEYKKPFIQFYRKSNFVFIESCSTLFLKSGCYNMNEQRTLVASCNWGEPQITQLFNPRLYTSVLCKLQQACVEIWKDKIMYCFSPSFCFLGMAAKQSTLLQSLWQSRAGKMMRRL